MAQAAPDAVVSHWSTLIENFQVSPLSFYQAVDEALKRRQVPETKNDRVDYRESGLLSANREYLHVTREKMIFDICGAPFGTGFFVSWWLAEDVPRLNPLMKALAVFVLLGLTGGIITLAGLVMGLVIVVGLLFGTCVLAKAIAADGQVSDEFITILPILGPLYRWLFKSDTYYRLDSMLMFQKAVHNAVLEVIDNMTAEKGIRALSDADRKPVMREFYGKRAA